MFLFTALRVSGASSVLPENSRIILKHISNTRVAMGENGILGFSSLDIIINSKKKQNETKHHQGPLEFYPARGKAEVAKDNTPPPPTTTPAPTDPPSAPPLAALVYYH